MIDLSKSYEFFDPDKCKEPIHIIGCGSVGSTLAEMIARTGIRNIVLYDFDTVEPHNLANQVFMQDDIGKPKVEVVRDMIHKIDPDINVKIYDKGWNGQPLTGYIFLAVDSMAVRNEIVDANQYNMLIKAMFDFRTSLTNAQHYGAMWSDEKQKKDLKASMDYTDEEAQDSTPTSACGTSLSVAPTIRAIVSFGVANWQNAVLNSKIKKYITVDPYNCSVLSFD